MWFLLQTTIIAITWNQTYFMVPLYDSIDHYKFIPEATLVIDGKVMHDPAMYYEYEVNYTRFSVISTQSIGLYRVDYRVTFPTFGLDTVESIYFDVQDVTPPIVILEENVTLHVKQNRPDYMRYIRYSDDHDDLKPAQVSVDYSQVNLNRVGRYPVHYHVSDLSGNVTHAILWISVVDLEPPTIQQDKEIRLKIGTQWAINSFFTIRDNHDHVIQTELIDDFVDYHLPGDYEAQIKATDQSGNETIVSFQIVVFDDEKPQVILSRNAIELDYLDTITEEELRAYIVRVSDNATALDIDDVIISHDIQSSILGTYPVIYQVSDQYGNQVQTTLNVHIKDLSPPIIHNEEDIVFDVFDREPYLQDYLILSDNYDSKEALTIAISGRVDMQKVDVYRLIVTVTDQAKNSTVKALYVAVVDRIAPTIDVADMIEIIDFKRPDFNQLIKVTDQYDTTPTLKIHDAQIDYETIGHHHFLVEAYDGSNNQTEKYIYIEIKDIFVPQINLLTPTVYIPYGNQPVDFTSYIVDIFDTYDKDLTKADVIITQQVDFEVVGYYIVDFQIIDASNNIGYEQLHVHIVDRTPPVIQVDSITIKQYELFHFREYVTAFDDYDGDVTQRVHINPAVIPTHSLGIYEVVFYVHDYSGNSARKTVLLTIEPTSQYQAYIMIVGGTMICLVIGVSVFYWYNKKRMI